MSDELGKICDDLLTNGLNSNHFPKDRPYGFEVQRDAPVPTREARLEAALREAMELVWDHHEIGHIRRAFEQGAGSCKLCKDGRYQKLAALLPESAEQATKGGI